MKKTIKIFLLILLLYLGYRITHYIIFGHTTDWNSKQRFTYFFKKKTFLHMDTVYTATARGRYDAVESYHYYPNVDIEQGTDPLLLVNDVYIRFSIWKFDKFEDIQISDIKFRTNQNLKDIKLNSGEVIDSESDKRKNVAYGYKYKTITVNTDEGSKIRDYFSSKKYKGFIGSFNRISLSNENGEHDIFYDFIPYKKNVLFMIFKDDRGFFLIVIDSELSIDRSVLELLNL